MRAVNLLPREQPRKRKKLGIARQLAILAPVVAIAVLAAGYLLAASKVNERRATLQTLQEELAALPPTAPTQPVDQSLVAQHASRVAALATALYTRVAWDRILSQVSAILPEDVWLTTLSAESPGGGTGAPTGESGSAPLQVNGYTYSQEGVARFLARLAVIPELTNVKLGESALTPLAGRLVVKFAISADLRSQGAG